MLKKEPKKVLKKYGSSFFWASQFLGKDLSNQIARLYKFCRYVDNIADSDAPNRESILKNIKYHLTNDGKENQPIVVKEFKELVDESSISIDAADDLMNGMLGDQNFTEVKDETELLKYCHAVAGTVGVMVQKILNCKDDESAYFAIDLGVAMQLTNIARDVLEDAVTGRKYIPRTWLDVRPERIAMKDVEDFEIVSRAIERIVSLADQYYHSALIGIHYIPIKSRIAIAIALRLYREIGIKLVQGGSKWWKGRTIVNNTTKVKLSLYSLFDLFPLEIKPHDKNLHKKMNGLTGAQKF